MHTKHALLSIRLWLFVGILGSLITACNLNNNQDITLDWQPDILAPIVKGTMGVLQQPDIQNVDFSIAIPASSLGLDGYSGTVPVVPAFGPIDSVKRTYTITDANNALIFESVEIDSIQISTSFSNPFPVALSAGMRIVFRNQGETNALITHTTTQEVAPNASYSFSQLVLSTTLNSNLEIGIENIQSPGGSNVDFSNISDLTMNIQLQISGITAITLAPNVSASFETTDNFDLGLGSEVENLEGSLILKHDNQTPLNLAVQAYFLADDQTTVIDSLFEVPSLISAGDTLSVRVSSTSLLNNLRNTKYIKFTTGFDTNGLSSSVRIDGATMYKFQLIADVKVKLKN
ncbi:hypothetical protein [Microscilla marina]|uniref:Lipoprotein, putative n=1 Tax=Microscilla marina ATCC 23134 TaxID=313606 RepID=A1ZRK5_MICM2|nr:hypothetical protein [Microscilla marina]EAY26910.1 lipoprotein, putative [Microscilla marina ATCC 23134]